MKKLIIILMMIFPLFIYAKGSVDVSTSNLQITVGSSKTITIKANNSAGKIDIASSNTNVATVSSSSIFLDMQSQTITVNAKSVGTTKITVKSIDVTTYDDENISGKTYTINVTVVEKPKTNLSNNNALKSISVTDYNLTKIDDKNYSLEVNSDVEKIYINASSEDSKAKIKGSGSHDLNYGENNIELIITSESGIDNVITVLITRKFEENITEIEDNNKDINELTQETSNKQENKINIWMIISAIELIIVLLLLYKNFKLKNRYNKLK